MDGLPYWKFFSDKWLGGNIQAHDMQTQGIFVNICARAWADGGEIEWNLSRLSRVLHVDKQVLDDAIQLLVEDEMIVLTKGGNITSKFILQQLGERKRLSKKRSNSGRKGGHIKQLNRASKCQASAKQNLAILEVEPEPEVEVEIESEKRSGKPLLPQVAYDLAASLLESILSWKSDFKKPTESAYKKWAGDIDKAMRLDKRSKLKIATVIAWLPGHSGSNGFSWRANILSGKKLRDQFDKLEVAMNSANPKEFVSRFK